ncbi:MAG: hypothetical protein ACRDYX_19515, partial [Egibacteraceae bacterium]
CRTRRPADDHEPEAILFENAVPPTSQTGTSRHVNAALSPAGAPAAALLPRARDQLSRLADVYLDRPAPTLAERERQQLRLDALCSAREGGVRAGITAAGCKRPVC